VGIQPAFLYAKDDLLAKWLLHWNRLSLWQKPDLLKQVEGAKISWKRQAHKSG